MDIFTCKLNFHTKQPLYQQLYVFLSNEIKAGNLKEGEKLPSKKALCSYLKISQSTIETAYEMLAAEGYIRAVPRSGFYVCALDLLPVHHEEKTPMPILQKPKKGSTYRYSFSTGAVDTTAFPYSSWAKITKEIMYQNPELLLHGDRQGDYCLRQALSKCLHEYRGVNCVPEQMIIGAGIEYLLDLIIQILEKDSVFALENPGYDTTYKIIENNNRKIEPIGLDENGMSVEQLEQSAANVAYITPSHQFPMGVTMPIGRRAQLLKWANSAPNRYLIEDDYDSEFRSRARPIPALQGWDENGKVIYVGTFSRSIAPSIRVAYLVLPPNLLATYQMEFSFSSSTVSRFEQHTLYRFIESGLFMRHLNRVGNLYKQRKEFLIDALTGQPFGKQIEITGDNAGLHFLLHVHNGMSEQELIQTAEKVGVKVHGLSEYDKTGQSGCPKSTLVLGYAGLSKQELADAVSLLGNAWSK
jgi:GntR family transcriptional regulator/MocR family aminotransferase